MVFESLVVDVLNRFLGDYVVNVDSSQLQLGIWGGIVYDLECQFYIRYPYNVWVFDKYLREQLLSLGVDLGTLARGSDPPTRILQ
ncbi:hypothetical protein scyTo_0026107 [Scyliorhinus torazame]|uniref:Uncharacterized protein n=1 Tax=Scyliorhinus torazame TaxID=75743 RepID=A0A401QJJ0_SCYTO|nr:hypothetical protein [Scyliorhinus torazame]